MSYEVWTDGSCKPKEGKQKNKKRSILGGLCSIGVIIKKDGVEILRHSEFVDGARDSSQAEYEALICAIDMLIELDVNSVTFYTDSKMMQKQMIEEYNVHSENIIHYYLKAMKLIQLIPEWNISWIPRSKNVEANKLASDAIKNWLSSNNQT